MNSFSEVYERRKKLSAYWRNKASDLYISAHVLWESMKEPAPDSTEGKAALTSRSSAAIACWSVYQMLCGMALELHFKAILVARDIEPEATHDLVKLSKKVEVSLTERQVGILRILSESVIWNGRYPVPKKEQHYEQFYKLVQRHLYEPVPGMSIGKTPFVRYNDALDWETISEIWKNLTELYEEYI